MHTVKDNLFKRYLVGNIAQKLSMGYRYYRYYSTTALYLYRPRKNRVYLKRFSAVLLDCPLPPPVTGGVCLATRVRYRQSYGLDTWSALLAYLFVCRICVTGLCFCFLLLFYFFPSPPIRSGEAFSSVIFSSLSLILFVFLDVAMVRKGKPASVTTGSRDRTNVRK